MGWRTDFVDLEDGSLIMIALGGFPGASAEEIGIIKSLVVIAPVRRDGAFGKGKTLGDQSTCRGARCFVFKGKIFQTPGCRQNWLCFEHMFLFWDTGFPIRVLGVCRIANVNRVRCNCLFWPGMGGSRPWH